MYSVIDFETTGLSPYDSDVIEYAVVRVGGGRYGEMLESLCAPGRSEITPFITKLTGITPDMVGGLPPFESHLAKMLDFIGDDTVVAHNIPFDMGFLRRYCREAGVPPPRKTLCTMTLSRRLCRGLPSHKLVSVAEALGVGAEGYHRALADAVTTARI